MQEIGSSYRSGRRKHRYQRRRGPPQRTSNALLLALSLMLAHRLSQLLVSFSEAGALGFKDATKEPQRRFYVYSEHATSSQCPSQCLLCCKSKLRHGRLFARSSFFGQHVPVGLAMLTTFRLVPLQPQARVRMHRPANLPACRSFPRPAALSSVPGTVSYRGSPAVSPKRPQDGTNHFPKTARRDVPYVPQSTSQGFVSAPPLRATKSDWSFQTGRRPIPPPYVCSPSTTPGSRGGEGSSYASFSPSASDVAACTCAIWKPIAIFPMLRGLRRRRDAVPLGLMQVSVASSQVQRQPIQWH